ncbi:MAG: hypothetical protein M0Z38_03045 [Deltaproteobacteria bacterium]|nr:hypothetical protein [Deltaproteobacteria bacterium]
MSTEDKILELERSLEALSGKVEELKKVQAPEIPSWVNRFTLGGYGEMHANFGEGDAADQFDIHRLVAYVGYTFNDWIRFHSETEIEHAFVSSESDGEISIEQAYLDLLLSDPVNVRFGRILTPIGILNRKHEPPTFYGVERPFVDQVIIPTTWSSDGIGIFGGIVPSLKYELYVVSGLDGSAFNATNGIRGGRIKERPSLHEPAVTGRLDFFPFVAWPSGYGSFLRLGASAYYGGLDNGNRGQNPGIDADLRVLSADFEYSVGQIDFRGVFAHENIDGATRIGNNVAEEIVGWYLEGAWRFFPDSWKKGKLARSDAAVFVRYEDFDTQYRMPAGVAENPAGDRTAWTLGASFYLTPSLVAKADYQVRDDATGRDLPDLVNLGIGWQF